MLPLLGLACGFFMMQTASAANCVPVATSCPLGVPDNSPEGTVPEECSGNGVCQFGACLCQAGFGDVDCGAQIRRTNIGNLMLSQGGKSHFGILVVVV